jgi:hypothetical protein
LSLSLSLLLLLLLLLLFRHHWRRCFRLLLLFLLRWSP